ncbi:hypothetical protein OESDEN_00226, partial [Oesophagostomum dentatum]
MEQFIFLDSGFLSHSLPRRKIKCHIKARRMILWYLTLSTFFLSTSFIGYAWITLKRKDQQVIFSILAFIAGLILLWF